MKRIALALFAPLLLWGSMGPFLTFSADFTQTVSAPNGKKIVYQGSMSLKQPSQARWSYAKPLPKEIYINGVEVVIYEPRLRQATYRILNDAIDMGAILRKAQKGSDGLWHARHEGIDAVITAVNGLPVQISYVDKNGYSVLVALSNIKANAQIDDGLFHFTPPAGIEIIR